MADGPRVWIRGSDALEQIRVAVDSSAAVAELPDARPVLHGAAVAHHTLQEAGETQQT